jgi:hypothetical protein
MGVILPFFQMSGNEPQRSERLKIFVRVGAITQTVSLSSLALIPSRPVALLALLTFKYFMHNI